MRQVGTIADHNLAERFADYLRAGGVNSTVDSSAEGYRVWVHDDDRLAAARDELPRFLTEPGHQRYLDAGQLVKAKFREDLKKKLAVSRNTVNVAEKWDRPAVEACPLTVALITITVAASWIIGLNPEHVDPRVSWFWFSTNNTLQPILHGEVWRILSPILLHADIMHLLFNMLMLWQLGTLIESRVGTFKVLGMVIVIAALSNFAQFYFVGPYFKGMSGVNYGIFGYLWIRGKLEPRTGFDLPQPLITMMLVVFVLGLVGVIPRIANWVHGIGLLTGATMAFGGILLKHLIRRK